MLFNSIEFVIFLPIVFIIYWFVTNKNLKLQNIFLVIASYVFYGWWDWRFLSLIVFSSLVDYFVGLGMKQYNKDKVRRRLLIVSIFVNIGFLGIFKYYNFFADSFAEAFTFFGRSIDANRLNIVLPVGISFYTFQTLSYSIDVYRRKLEPTKDIVSFFAFVSFFPQLVAGPIERASNLLPQFYKKRVLEKDKAIDGLRQMLWGFFKKVVIADNISKMVVPIFDYPSEMTSVMLLLGLGLFSIQIYADFSGYSDIAIGLSRLFGFNLKINFKYPLFARNVGERWRNWHISLSTWFRDYIYIPMGGSRGGKWTKFRNVMILFAISGLWHGANWTFVAWGVINGLFFAPSMLLNRNRIYLEPISKNRMLPSIKEFFQMIITFSLISFTYTFFRAKNIHQSWVYIGSIFRNYKLDQNGNSAFDLYSTKLIMTVLVFTTIMLIAEWINRSKDHAFKFQPNSPSRFVMWGIYYATVFIIFWFAGGQETFIYFQF